MEAVAARARGVSQARPIPERGVGHVWPGFTATCVVCMGIAGTWGANVTGGWRIVCLAFLGVFVVLTAWLSWLTYAWHTEKWPYKPPPPRPGTVVSGADRTL